MTKLALFDLDDTLVDRVSAMDRWTDSFIAEHDLGRAAKDILLQLDGDGNRMRHEFCLLVRSCFNLRPSVNELFADYALKYPLAVTQEDLNIASLALLRDAGWKIVIVSGGPAFQADVITAAGLNRCIDGWCLNQEIVGRQNRDIFDEAAQLVGLPLEGWMVGDSPEQDIVRATDVGLHTAWLCRGRRWARPDCRPDLIVESVAEAVDLLVSMAG